MAKIPKNILFEKQNGASHIYAKFERFILIPEAMIAKDSLIYFWL